MSWHHIKQAGTVLFIVLTVSASAGAIYALAHGTKFLSVQSGSMVPTFRKGDLVVDTRVPARHIAVGDVVTYTNPAFMDGQPVSHRVVDTPSPKNGYRFTTKGDANKLADPQFGSRGIIGKVSYSVPYLGFVFDFVRKPLGLIALIYIPALAIVIAEIRRLMQYYKSMEPYRAASGRLAIAAAAASPAMTSATSAPTTASVINKIFKDKTRLARRVRFIPAVTAAAVITAIIVAVPTVQAALMSTATLTSTTLSTKPLTAGNVLIYKVTFGSNTGNTGGGSTTNTSTSTTTNTNNVNVTNNNPQSATSGNASASGGGSATSGNASTSSSTNININITNGGNSGSGSTVSTGGPNTGSSNTGGTSGNNASTQTITLYNPTDQPVNLTNWQLSNATSTQVISSGTIAAKSYYVYTWPAANGLLRAGDHLILRNASATSLDGLSWGSDTTQFSPSVATTATTLTLTRKSPTTDTNTASDWQTAP